jgi:hypothetical protein
VTLEEVTAALSLARAEYERLTDETKAIESQLTSKNRLIDGRRMTDVEYHNWRATAIGALRHRQREAREAKARVRALSDQQHELKKGNTCGDVPTMLRELAGQLEEERAKFRAMRELLAIAAARVPEWAGASDEAHAWWMRAKKVLEETT